MHFEGFKSITDPVTRDGEFPIFTEDRNIRSGGSLLSRPLGRGQQKAVGKRFGGIIHREDVLPGRQPAVSLGP
jgi:hypothetical protein